MELTLWAIFFTIVIALSTERLVHGKENRAAWGICLGMNLSSLFSVISRVVA